MDALTHHISLPHSVCAKTPEGPKTARLWRAPRSNPAEEAAHRAPSPASDRALPRLTEERPRAGEGVGSRKVDARPGRPRLSRAAQHPPMRRPAGAPMAERRPSAARRPTSPLPLGAKRATGREENAARVERGASPRGMRSVKGVPRGGHLGVRRPNLTVCRQMGRSADRCQTALWRGMRCTQMGTCRVRVSCICKRCLRVWNTSG